MSKLILEVRKSLLFLIVIVIRRRNHCDSNRDSPNSQTEASPREEHLVYLVEIIDVIEAIVRW